MTIPYMKTAPGATAAADSDHTFPPDLDPETHPIIAQHYFGIELPNLRPFDVLWRAA